MAEYIEREKLLEILKNRKKDYPMKAWQKCNYEGGWQDAVEQIEDDIKNMLTADVVPVRHGAWVQTNIFKCSECGYSFEPEGYTAYFNYCPNCGAKMDGKDGEQNAKA